MEGSNPTQPDPTASLRIVVVVRRSMLLQIDHHVQLHCAEQTFEVGPQYIFEVVRDPSLDYEVVLIAIHGG